MKSPQNAVDWDALHQIPELRSSFQLEIRDSWERCCQNKVDPVRTKPPMCEDVGISSQPNSNILIATSLEIIKPLIGYLDQRYATLILDNKASILKVFAAKELQERMSNSGIGEGTTLAEEFAGTNAAAVGLVTKRPQLVLGSEHFCQYAIEYACAFSPILDQYEVIGGVCVFCPVKAYNYNIMATAVTLAQYIVSRMAGDKWNDIINNSVLDGIMVVDDQKNISYMNNSCCRILKMAVQPTFNLPLTNLIDNKKPDNHYFWKALDSGRFVSDESIVVNTGKEKVQCNISFSPIALPDRDFSGTILVIQENERINRLVRSRIGNGARTTFNDIIGENARFLRVKGYAVLAANSNSNILMLGESGTGKDVFAQAIHNDSPRRNGPFIAINCAALPRELIASELFGYEDGAFTGARKGGNMGKFELADHGTIFLDEIGDMPFDLQSTLLRVIEDRSVVRLGGSKTIPVDVRIIAATNKDLESEMARHRFRRDLYYRLGVIRVNIPPLRDRPDDIIPLANHFNKVICNRLDKPLRSLSPDVISAFQQYHWPGNVRELQNVIEGAIQISNGPVITQEYIELNLTPSIFPGEPNNDGFQLKTDEQSQKQLIIFYLKQFDNNKAKTARALGISRKTLYKRLKEFNVDSVSAVF